MSKLDIGHFRLVAFALCISSLLTLGVAVAEGPVAWWSFDSIAEGFVTDRAADRDDPVEGHCQLLRGAVGNALLFDGFTTVIDRPAAEAPRLNGSFSIEAWVAQAAYPWNWCPILTQQRDEQAGYAFSVGPRGQIRLQVAADGAWQSCTSEDWVLPLRTWIHVAATFDSGKGITLYANGAAVGTLELKGEATLASDIDLRIGTNHELAKPSHIHRPHGTVASFWCLDGAIDELKLYNRALSPEDVVGTFAGASPVAECELQPRQMPSGPKGPGRFGAVDCKLKYYDAWDALWRVDDDPDVLVRFDQTPVRVVFWRGSRYSPAWVTDNDQWMADQSVEAWKTGEADTDGCFEHMQGEQVTLRFIENPTKELSGVPEALTIQRYNFRSPYDPVIIYEPGNRMHYVKDAALRGYERPGACNHWPVGQARCDGRTVQAADRPTHFLGFPISSPPVHEQNGRSWWNGIYGMTDLPMETLVTVAKSWNFPPGLELSDGFEDRGYDRGQRAFILKRSDSSTGNLKIAVRASKESPVYNPALVIRDWGTSEAALTINGKEVAQGPGFRIGHRHGLENSDLIVWIEHVATEPLTITLTSHRPEHWRNPRLQKGVSSIAYWTRRMPSMNTAAWTGLRWNFRVGNRLVTRCRRTDLAIHLL